MKKNIIVESLIILSVSLLFAILLPNLFKMNKELEMPALDDLIIISLSSFAMMSVVVHLFRPKDKWSNLPDGYHELYNAGGQLTKKGMFFGGKHVSGIRNVYNTDGSFSHAEKCVNGTYRPVWEK